MKRLVLMAFLIVLLAGQSFCTTLNVLIQRQVPRTEISFLQNYLLAIGDHFYGPIAKENTLLLHSSSGGITLLLRHNGTGTLHSLGVAKNPVYILRTLNGVDTGKPIELAKLQPRKMPAGGVHFTQDAQSARTDFYTIFQPSYGGPIAYRGPLRVYLKNGINLAETVELEYYVTQVLNCELGGEKSLSALKAQSVLIRTFALYISGMRLKALAGGNNNWLYFQLFSTPVDQAYNCRKRVEGREAPSLLVKQAVQETAGEVLLRQKQLARVQYNTCASVKIPPGVICQEKLVRLARSGKSYKAVLASLVPGAKIAQYDLTDFYEAAARVFIKQELKK